MVLSAADRFGDAEAIVDGPLRLFFTQLTERVRVAAGAFTSWGVPLSLSSRGGAVDW
ncbi:hypothetical protein [Streptomyces sp. NPDC005799]|uniref:hypothetical protein n=1 Tax=Streptomyces sp. NPDC005799 TaxID=3154678 RepID=UPI0033D0CD8B